MYRIKIIFVFLLLFSQILIAQQIPGTDSGGPVRSVESPDGWRPVYPKHPGSISNLSTLSTSINGAIVEGPSGPPPNGDTWYMGGRFYNEDNFDPGERNFYGRASETTITGLVPGRVYEIDAYVATVVRDDLNYIPPIYSAQDALISAEMLNQFPIYAGFDIDGVEFVVTDVQYDWVKIPITFTATRPDGTAIIKNIAASQLKTYTLSYGGSGSANSNLLFSIGENAIRAVSTPCVAGDEAPEF